MEARSIFWTYLPPLPQTLRSIINVESETKDKDSTFEF
jgi:hypothetical protein